MKRIRSLFKSYMIRPTLYRSVTKFAIALAAVLLWDRFLNRGPFTVLRDGGLVAGMVLLAAAWIGYLRLDGIRINHLPKKEQKKKPRRSFGGDIADYMDEHIVSFDELEQDEQMVCGLASSLLAALAFLIPSLIASVF